MREVRCAGCRVVCRKKLWGVNGGVNGGGGAQDGGGSRTVQKMALGDVFSHTRPDLGTSGFVLTAERPSAASISRRDLRLWQSCNTPTRETENASQCMQMLRCAVDREINLQTQLRGRYGWFTCTKRSEETPVTPIPDRPRVRFSSPPFRSAIRTF